MMGGGYGGGGMTIAWIWPMIFVLGLVFLIWGLMRARSSSRDGRSVHSGSAETSSDRARAILRERYARGEISEAELRERLQVLDER